MERASIDTAGSRRDRIARPWSTTARMHTPAERERLSGPAWTVAAQEVFQELQYHGAGRVDTDHVNQTARSLAAGMVRPR